MASRRKGRILAFQALYFWDTLSASFKSEENSRASIEELSGFEWIEEEKRNKLDEGMCTFSRILIAGTVGNIRSIDNIIKNHLENWDILRVNRVDLAILRISVYSLMFQKEIAPSIVIDEAIGISREFGGDDSYRFINGVLDSIRKTLQGQKT
jgi:N utilization substance protein B